MKISTTTTTTCDRCGGGTGMAHACKCAVDAEMRRYEDRVLGHAIDIIRKRLSFGAEDTSMTRDNAEAHALLTFGQLEREEFACLFLNVHRQLIEHFQVGVGTLTECPVYPREIVKAALKANAAYTILIHNHPAGSLRATNSDIILTHHLQKCLQMVDVVVWDHLIVAGGEVHSMKDAGEMLEYPLLNTCVS